MNDTNDSTGCAVRIVRRPLDETEYADPVYGEFHVGDTVEFLCERCADIEYRQQGTVERITDCTGWPIEVAFDSSGQLVPCSPRVLDVVLGGGLC